MKKKYEILNSLPATGPMYISVTENNEPFYSEGFVVRFFKSDNTEWVANFEPGWTDLNGVIELKKSDHLLVIAFGMCYVMNVDEFIPIKSFGVNFSKLLQTENDQLILQNNTELTIVEANGNHWSTEQISWDGIRNLKYQNRIISGLSFDAMNQINEWDEFTFNIDTKELTGGSVRKYEFKKPWWKFW